MATLNDLIVKGKSRMIMDTYAGDVYADHFITNNGTSSQFVKGDGSLDSTQYATATNSVTDVLVGTGNNADKLDIYKGGSHSSYVTVPYATETIGVRRAGALNSGSANSIATTTGNLTFQQVTVNVTDTFPINANQGANVVLDLNTYLGGSYNHQLGFSQPGEFYHRYRNGGTWYPWKRIFHEGDPVSTRYLVEPDNFPTTPTTLPLVATTSGNRLALLSPDQVIIEKTVDGGVTWTDAGISDTTKKKLFLGNAQNASVPIPLLNGIRNKLCGIRITFTAMKYDIPEGTVETSKYNYWNSTYVTSTNRYCTLDGLYLWLTGLNDCIRTRVYMAKGSTSTTWVSADHGNNMYLAGNSGGQYIALNGYTFGGNTSATTNYWNYRIECFTDGYNGGDLSSTGNTSAQAIYRVSGYGGSGWVCPNNLMKIDHLYNWDFDQTMITPSGIYPDNGNPDLGTSTNRWGTVYGNIGNFSGDFTIGGNLTVSGTTTMSGYLPLTGGTGSPMTGSIDRLYSSTNGSPMLSLTSNNQDAWLWRINNSSTLSEGTSALTGFGLKYNGTGSTTNEKSLSLQADNGTTTQVRAVEVMQNGDTYLYGVGGYDGTNPSSSNTVQESINSNALIAGNELEIVTKTRILPAGYTQIEYIESNGTRWIDANNPGIAATQYIDTGIQVNSTNQNLIRIEVDGNFGNNISNSNSTGWRIDGAGSPEKRRYLGINYQNKLVYGNGSNDVVTTYTENDPMGRHLYIIDYKNGTLTRDGESIATFTASASSGNDHNLWIFGWTADREKQRNSRKYGFKVYIDDVLQFDGVPAIQDSNGTVGMYDMVGGTFISPSGTGTLGAGPSVAPYGFGNTMNFTDTIIAKDYSYACTSADTDYGYVYFLNVVPKGSNYFDHWHVRYRLYVTHSSVAQCAGYYDCCIGSGGNTVVYSNYNNYYSSSYYPIYTHLLIYYDSVAKYGDLASRQAHPAKLGARIYSAYSATSVRNYRIEVYECVGCEVSFPDEIEHYGGTGGVYDSTIYGISTSFNATSLGLQESGDANDITYMRLTYARLTAGTNGLKMYSLCMQDSDGNWQSFTTGTGGRQTTKVPNISTGFRLSSPRYYLSMSTDVANGTIIGNSIVYAYISLIDFAYSTNITNVNGQGLYAYKPLYIVGTVHDDGLFYLDSHLDSQTNTYTPWWTQDEPTTEDGKVYLKVTETIYPDYNLTSYPTRNYRGDLIFDAPPMWFKDGEFQSYPVGNTFTPATDVNTPGSLGLVPAPPTTTANSTIPYYLGSDGTWNNISDAVVSSASGQFLPLTGGALTPVSSGGTGRISGLLSSIPATGTDDYKRSCAATIGLCQDNFLQLSGNSESSNPMTGPLYMGTGLSTHQIKNLSDPTNSNDAATKSYVDKVSGNTYSENDILASDIDGLIGVQTVYADSSRGTRLGFSRYMQPNSSCHIFVYGGSSTAPASQFTQATLLIPKNLCAGQSSLTQYDTVIIDGNVTAHNGDEDAGSVSITIPQGKLVELNIMYVTYEYNDTDYYRTIIKTFVPQ